MTHQHLNFSIATRDLIVVSILYRDDIVTSDTASTKDQHETQSMGRLFIIVVVG
jgi:hypothetical protein